MTLSVRGAVAAVIALTAVSWTAAQTPPRPNPELESLQAHFELVIKRRHEQVFGGITTVQQWEQRKQQTRTALQRMLWADMPWPERPPRATVTSRQEYAGYTVENLVLESIPGVFLTANLYLPRSAAKPVPVVLYQCGHASKSLFRRHGAWFAANLGVLRHTDIPETARLLGDTVRVLGETPAMLRSLETCGSVPECLRDR